MKTFLQNLLIFFSLALCGLIVYYGVRETGLRKDIQGLHDDIHDKAQAIQDLTLTKKRYEGEIQRLDGLQKQLTETVKSNNVQIAELSKSLKKAEFESEKNQKQMEAFKEAFETANENLKKEAEYVKTMNVELHDMVGRYNMVITNLTPISTSISEMARKWSAMAEGIQKLSANAQRDAAVTNNSVMVADFNAFASRWNDLQKALATKTTNAPPHQPAAGTNAPAA